MKRLVKKSDTTFNAPTHENPQMVRNINDFIDGFNNILNEGNKNSFVEGWKLLKNNIMDNIGQQSSVLNEIVRLDNDFQSLATKPLTECSNEIANIKRRLRALKAFFAGF